MAVCFKSPVKQLALQTSDSVAINKINKQRVTVQGRKLEEGHKINRLYKVW